MAMHTDARAIKRNVFLLAVGMAALYGMTQLAAAMATLTFVLVARTQALVGLGPAIFLAAGALAALAAGRAMDRYGRVPVLAAGFIAGIAGTLLTALGCYYSATGLIVAGFIGIGAAGGTVMLSRLAAADLFVPQQRARGMGLVLMGAVVGALLGPLVFMPLLADKVLTPAALVWPWIAASGFMLLGLVAVVQVRPDPRDIAKQLNAGLQLNAGVAPTPAVTASLSVVLRRAGIFPALFAAQVSVAVMVTLMTLAGYIMIGHGHTQAAVFPAISAHFIGMFALMAPVGRIIDGIGRTSALILGLVLLAFSVLSLIWLRSAGGAALAMFGIGLGWNFAYVAASAELIDRSAPNERGRLLGFSDLLAGLSGAGLALLGGFGLSTVGLVGVCVGGFVLALLPVLTLALRALPARARRVRA